MFGCLSFATILNNSDKFDSRSEKCVLVGYASFKKGYKLYSLERKQFIYSRDVTFFENVFPFKDKNVSVMSHDLDHTNFFNEAVYEDHGIPSDDNNNVAPYVDGRNSPLNGSPTIDHNENYLGHFQGSNGSSLEDEMSATHKSETDFDPINDYESANSEGINTSFPITETNQNVQTQPLRRSERISTFPNKYNEFVVNSKVKYGLEKFVNYSKLSSENLCFTAELNKSFEPKTYKEASRFPHWREAINKEMKALYDNDTFEIVFLPKGRKAIGSKWVFKIKYKSNGEIDKYKARLVAKGYNQ